MDITNYKKSISDTIKESFKKVEDWIETGEKMLEVIDRGTKLVEDAAELVSEKAKKFDSWYKNHKRKFWFSFVGTVGTLLLGNALIKKIKPS